MRREHASACDPTKNEQQRSRTKKRQVKGAIAQLGEHLLCKQGVRGSIPRSSTILDKRIFAKFIIINKPEYSYLM